MTPLCQSARLGASLTKSLASSMRALTLNSSAAVTCRAAIPKTLQQQTRSFSQRLLATHTCRHALCCRPTIARALQGANNGAVEVQKQQTRGMKVHSSVKKRCEHCKVSMVWAERAAGHEG